MIVDKEDTLARYNEWPDHFEACVAGLLDCEDTARRNDNDIKYIRLSMPLWMLVEIGVIHRRMLLRGVSRRGA